MSDINTPSDNKASNAGKQQQEQTPVVDMTGWTEEQST